MLLTADDLTRRGHYRNARQTVERLLALGVLPIVNENDTVATEEIRFGDNDRLAALVAHLSVADALVLLSDIDAVYDGDPRVGPAARIDTVHGPADLDAVVLGSAARNGVGTGGMATKVEAAFIASQAGVPVLVTSTPRPPRRWPVSRSARCSPRTAAVPRPGSSGCATPPAPAGRCCSTRAPWPRCASGGPRCWPPASPVRSATSWPTTRSSWSGPTARSWRGAGLLRRPRAPVAAGPLHR